MCSRRVLGKNIYLINSHTCILQITFFPGTDLLVMQSLLMLLSSSLLTCDIYSIKNIYILKAFLLFTFNKFRIENVYNGTSAKTGPAGTASRSGSLI